MKIHMQNQINSIIKKRPKLTSSSFNFFQSAYKLKSKYRICVSILETLYKPARRICLLMINKTNDLIENDMRRLMYYLSSFK